MVSKINIFKEHDEYFLQLFRIEIDILFVKTIETVSSQVFVQRVSRHIVWKIISWPNIEDSCLQIRISIDRVLKLACSLNVRDENLLNSE